MSDLSRWPAANDLLDRTLALPASQRRDFLNQEVQDPDLRQALDAILREDDTKAGLLTPGGAFERPVFDDLEAKSVEDEPFPERVGCYRLLREIGRGGMARVFLAERVEGGFEQRVALKLVRPAAGPSRLRQQRFAQERQILASLQHPSIARLLDGGETESSEPFFAMELIDGEPIETHCRQNRLDLRQRLRLFLQVARAVAYAHGNLVVHRDIKSANVLVTPSLPTGSEQTPSLPTGSEQTPSLPTGSEQTPSAEVKLLDFGIAKLLEADDSDNTATGQQLLTPECASPEQLLGEPITTASDVYQLGHLLYRLLTDLGPYEGHDATALSLQAAILSETPSLPSRATSNTETQKRKATHGAWKHETVPWIRDLRGDLDAIVMMALRKEPERRYSTVQALIDDLEAYLAGRPVRARANTLRYRLSRFLGRNRAVVAVAAAAVVGLVLATGAFTLRLAKERDRARQEAAKAREIAEFLERVFRLSDPSESRGETVTVREVLDKAVADLEGEEERPPVIDVTLRRTLGSVHRNLGLLDSAETILESAKQRSEEQLGANHEETLATLDELGVLLWQRGRYAEAEAVLSETVERSRAALGDDAAQTLTAANDLGLVVWRQGRFDEAEAIFNEVVERRQRLHGENDVPTLETRNNLAGVYYMRGEYDQAAALYEEVWMTGKETRGADHPSTLDALNNLAMSLAARDDFAAARRKFEELITLRQKVLGPEHPRTLGARAKLGDVLRQLGELDEAEALVQSVYEIRQRTLGPEHPDTLWSKSFLAQIRRRQGRSTEAERLLQEVLASRKRVAGVDHPDTLYSLRELADLRQERGLLDEASALYREALAGYERTTGDHGYWTIITLSDLGLVTLQQGDAEAALSRLSTARERAEKAFPDDPKLVGTMCLREGRALVALSELDVAKPRLERALALLDGEGRDEAEHTLAEIEEQKGSDR